MHILFAALMAVSSPHYATNSAARIADYVHAKPQIRFAYDLGVSDGLLAQHLLCIPATTTSKQLMGVVDNAVLADAKDFGPAFLKAYLMPVAVGALEAKYGCSET